ncbi:hypothetical protein [Streptomyces longwoodensis]|uniref:hypothetical protein n=1 Tax=Streptomyces longwoodensis TaxID=68231 RepID=UPI00225B7617|nr:hypothetical protein [Streptomyces longwoodensis]MCX4993872.1 hypothetical protein [Streptomyces longwoodensis]
MTTEISSVTDAISLLDLPPLDDLTENQVRGTACVWCATSLSVVTAVDLGERRHKRLDGSYSTFPRACRPCTRAAGVRALADHAPLCEQCTDDPGACTTGMALQRLIREHRR